MTAAVAEGSRRARILAHLEDHPGLTAWELGCALGLADGSLRSLLRDMKQKAEVVTASEWRPQQGRQVTLWYVAPPGTVPPPVSPEAAGRRRRRDRESLRRRRARACGTARPRLTVAAPLLPAAACRAADPRLFFPPEGDEGAEAKAICAGCPVRAECYALAVANGEECGIWGGVDFAAGVTASATSRREAHRHDAA